MVPTLFAYSRRLFSSPISDHHQQLFKQAANAISSADALYITAGAGMGVDSGLPDVYIHALTCYMTITNIFVTV